MEFLKNCSQCQIRFSPKRSDQKFCSLKCKNKQNNKKVMAEYHQRKREDVVTKESRFEQPKDSHSPLLFCYDYGYQFIDAKTVRTFKSVQ